jgi:CRISPR-associated protein Cas5d
MNSVRIRAKGPYACFTRPEFRSAPVSYEAMTPSAAVGLLSCIYWKPEMRWIIEKIEVLNPIRFMTIKRNELESIVKGADKTSMAKNTVSSLNIHEDRMQRSHLILYDVDYVIQARIDTNNYSTISEKRNELLKHCEIFNRRMKHQQEYRTPYLGIREYHADISFADNAPPPINETKPLGPMIHTVYNEDKKHDPIYFNAILRNGIIDVPVVA